MLKNKKCSTAFLKSNVDEVETVFANEKRIESKGPITYISLLNSNALTIIFNVVEAE